MKERLRQFLTDRFVIFALIGISFFWLDTRADGDEAIRVGSADIQMLEGRWQLQTGVAPNDQELKALVDHYVREEILVREARRLGLDRGDVILRRRLAQKMEFLIRDRLSEPELSRQAVETYFTQNSERYTRPKQVGFRHIYLGTGAQPDRTEIDIIRRGLVETPDANAWRDQGQAFMLAREYAPRPQSAFLELFGADFAELLMQEDAPGDWWGPVRSSYGWHLVQTLVVQPERRLDLDEAFTAVAADLRAEHLEQSESEAFVEISQRYPVSIDWPSE